jgi:hypothetical protein
VQALRRCWNYLGEGGMSDAEIEKSIIGYEQTTAGDSKTRKWFILTHTYKRVTKKEYFRVLKEKLKEVQENMRRPMLRMGDMERNPFGGPWTKVKK